MLTQEEIESFNRDGVLVLRNFYDYDKEIKPIQEAIYNIIDIINNKYSLNIKREPFSGENFYNGYLKIIKIDRSYGGEIYDAIKQIPAFLRLVSNEKNEILYKQLRGSNSVGIGLGNYGIRIDNPMENRFRTDWHQEYLTHLRSKDGVVFWSPLHTTTKEMGAVEVLLNSQKDGLQKLKNINTDNIDSNYTTYTNGLKIDNIDSIVNKYKSVIPETLSSDLILIDYLTIHRSGTNISHNPRYSMQLRYFNFENEEGQSIKWSGSFASGVNPKDLYPEYFL